jgi:hypothetical protein
MALDVEMRLVDEDALRTFHAIGALVGNLLEEGKVERTPRIEEMLNDLSTLVVYALGTRKYRQEAHN